MNACMHIDRKILSSEHGNIMGWLGTHRFNQATDQNVLSSKQSVGRIKDGESLASYTNTTGHTSSGICCSTQTLKSSCSTMIIIPVPGLAALRWFHSPSS